MVHQSATCNLPGQAHGRHISRRALHGPRPRPQQPGAGARLALCRASGAVCAGAGRRRHQAHQFRPVDHRMEADPRRDTAAQRRRVAGRIPALPEDPAICRAQQGHEPGRLQVDLLVGMGAPHPGAQRRPGLRPAAAGLLGDAAASSAALGRNWSAFCCSAACKAPSAGGWWPPAWSTASPSASTGWRRI